MGKALDEFMKATRLQLDEITARYPFPGSKEAERAARIEAKLPAIKNANPTLDELQRMVAELIVRSQMISEGLADLRRFSEIGIDGWKAMAVDRREAGRCGAEALHKPNKAKREKLCEIWASGKYRSRDACAEKEHDGLQISTSTARRWLRGTAQPTGRKGQVPSRTG